MKMITYLSFRNFRGFQLLELDDLKQITLLSGKNNVGKSSALEGAFLLLDHVNPQSFTKINAFRGNTAIPVSTGLWEIAFYQMDTKKPLEIKAVFDGEPSALQYLRDDSFVVLRMLRFAIKYKFKISNGINNYIEYAKTTKINAFVVDIKDDQVPAYKSKIYETYSKTNFKYAYNSVEDYEYAISRLKEEGFYVIGRITTFKDDYYAIDNPDNVIKKSDGSLLKHNGSYWPTAFNRDVWKFNVDLAKEAVNLFHFNEIQFDYCRFPDRLNTYEKAGTIDYNNIYKETKSEAIQKFLMYATREIHKLNVYVSVDVFGESSWGYVTAYGQYWPAISNIVDVISSMPYTDHFGKSVDTWSNPYQTVYNWAKGAATRQTEIPTPAIPRTWITAYDTPHWNPTVVYDANKISAQAQALVDAGLKGGFITWNSASNLYKYRQIASAFSKDYA